MQRHERNAEINRGVEKKRKISATVSSMKRACFHGVVSIPSRRARRSIQAHNKDASKKKKNILSGRNLATVCGEAFNETVAFRNCTIIGKKKKVLVSEQTKKKTGQHDEVGKEQLEQRRTVESRQMSVPLTRGCREQVTPSENPARKSALSRTLLHLSRNSAFFFFLRFAFAFVCLALPEIRRENVNFACPPSTTSRYCYTTDLATRVDVIETTASVRRDRIRADYTRGEFVNSFSPMQSVFSPIQSVSVFRFRSSTDTLR